MKKKNLALLLRKTIPFLFGILLLLTPAFSHIVVINSQDWRDVLAGLQYAVHKGYNAYFTNSPNPAGLFNILPKDTITLIESESKPYIPNLASVLRAKGYTITETIKTSPPNLNLIPQDVNTFYVVESDYPALSLPAGALASASNAWVLTASDDTLAALTGRISSAQKVILVGWFKRSVLSALSPYASERVEGRNRYEIATRLAEKFMEVKPTKQIIITEGKYLELELLQGKSPVLLVGTNLLPDEVKNFILSKDISTVVAIGPQLTYVGERIREITNKKTAVFIKFGQSTPGVSQGIYAISLFPLPSPEIKLSIARAIYDPAERKVRVLFRNLGNTGVFAFTNFRVLDENNNEIASAGDAEPVFIGAGEDVLISYEVSLSDLTKNYTVEFYTSYGEDVANLHSYLTEKGKFGPPLKLNLEIGEISDKSQVEITKVEYDKWKKIFRIGIKNTGSVTAYVVVKLRNVKQYGIPVSLSSPMVRVLPGEERYAVIRAELDEADIEEILSQGVKVEVDYGESRDLLAKSRKYELSVEVTSGILSGIAPWIIAAVVIGAIAVFFLSRKRKSRGYAGKYRYSYKKRF